MTEIVSIRKAIVTDGFIQYLRIDHQHWFTTSQRTDLALSILWARNIIHNEIFSIPLD